jgi:hypothetical protein
VTLEEPESDLLPVFIENRPSEKRLEFVIVVMRFVPKSRCIGMKREGRSPEKSVTAPEIPLVLTREQVKDVFCFHR